MTKVKKKSQQIKKTKTVKFAIQKGFQIGFIFDRFSIKKVTRKATLFQDRIVMEMWCFGTPCWSNLEVFLERFLALAKSVFLMYLPFKISVIRCRNGMGKCSKAEWFLTCVLEATFALKFAGKLPKMDPQIDKIRSKTGSKNRCVFGRRRIELPSRSVGRSGVSGEVGGEQN